MRALFALVLAASSSSVLVACSSSAPAAEPAVTGTRAPSAPTGPAPRIAFRDGTFDTSQLPVIARSGALAVVAAVDGDGGRGYPNLRLEVRDRTDRVIEQHTVMVSNDFESLAPDGAHATPELERRIAVANRRLADLHSEHDLVPMRAFEASAAGGRETPVEGDNLSVTFAADNQLRVRTREGTTLATANGLSWLAPSGKRCPQCPPCENPARLRGIYKAAGVDAVIVRITYAGTDTCWEPGDQLHLIAW